MIRKHASSFKPRLEILEDRLCLSTITNPALVFEASYFVKNVQHQDLFLTTANGASTQQLTNDTLDDEWPIWSPDGTRIAFLHQQVTGQDIGYGGIYSIKPDGSGLTLLFDSGPTVAVYYGGDNHMDWSPDGRKIVFAGNGPDAAWVPALFALDVAKIGRAHV